MNEKQIRFDSVEMDSIIKNSETRERIEGILSVRERFKEKVYRIIDLIEEHSVETRTHINSVSWMFILWMAEILANFEYFNKHNFFNEEFYEKFRKITPEEFWLAAGLHDVGKLFIPSRILHKVWALTKEDWQHLENHVRTGWRFLSELYCSSEENTREDCFLKEIMIHLVEYHHKTVWDWYPKELQGSPIPFYAEFLRLCDVYDALRRKRSYKNPIERNEALKILYWMQNSFQHPEIVELFMELEPLFDSYINEEIHTLDLVNKYSKEHPIDFQSVNSEALKRDEEETGWHEFD